MVDVALAQPLSIQVSPQFMTLLDLKAPAILP